MAWANRVPRVSRAVTFALHFGEEGVGAAVATGQALPGHGELRGQYDDLLLYAVVKVPR